MTYANTGLTQALAPFYGSCKIELSEDAGTTWVNVGLARGVAFNEQLESTTIQADNGPNISKYVSSQKVEITFNGLEFYLPTLNKIRGGIDLLSVTTGGSTITATDTIAAGSVVLNKPYWFANQGNTTSQKPAVTTIKSYKAGTTVTLSDTKDFSTFGDASNRYGIMLLSTGQGAGTSYASTRALHIAYTYKTIPSRKLTSGGLSTITSKWFRLTNKQMVSGTAKYRYLVVYSGSLNAGMNLAFKSSNEADPILETPFSIMAELDATRTAGDQLFFVQDEIGIA
jgi:hypothetical protein